MQLGLWDESKQQDQIRDQMPDRAYLWLYDKLHARDHCAVGFASAEFEIGQTNFSGFLEILYK